MKLSQLKQQIEELDAKAKADPTSANCYSIEYKISGLFADNGPELLRRLLVAEEALKQIEEKSCEALQPCENEGPYNPPEWAGEFYDMSERALRVVCGDVPEIGFGNISTIRGEEE